MWTPGFFVVNDHLLVFFVITGHLVSYRECPPSSGLQLHEFRGIADNTEVVPPQWSR